MNKTAEDNYVPYGDEWKKEVSKMPKAFFIDMVSKWMIKNKEQISSLSSEVERLRGELSEAQQADDWVRVEDGLPEIDTPVEVITEYENWASGKKVNQSDRFIGYMDEYGDLIICPTDDSYGWQFNDCVTKWRPLPSPPKQ